MGMSFSIVTDAHMMFSMFYWCHQGALVYANIIEVLNSSQVAITIISIGGRRSIVPSGPTTNVLCTIGDAPCVFCRCRKFRLGLKVVRVASPEQGSVHQPACILDCSIFHPKHNNQATSDQGFLRLEVKPDFVAT